MAKEIVSEEAVEKNTQVYELGYLFVPTIEEDRVAEVYSNLKDVIVSLGGEMIADEMPKPIGLAYTMVKVIANVPNKFNNAYFGWVKFDMDKANIAKLKAKLDLDVNVIRFLITKTVRENTMATKRYMPRDMARRKPFTAKKEGESEVPVEINKEEIDKEIDALASVA